MLTSLLLQMVVTLAPIDSVGYNTFPSDSIQFKTTWTVDRRVDSLKIAVDGGSGPTLAWKVLPGRAKTANHLWWVWAAPHGTGRWQISVTAYKRTPKGKHQIVTATRQRPYTNPVRLVIFPISAELKPDSTQQFCDLYRWHNGARVFGATTVRPYCDQFLNQVP